MKKIVFLLTLLILFSCSKTQNSQITTQEMPSTKTGAQDLENVENELSQDLDKLLELPNEK